MDARRKEEEKKDGRTRNVKKKRKRNEEKETDFHSSPFYCPRKCGENDVTCYLSSLSLLFLYSLFLLPSVLFSLPVYLLFFFPFTSLSCFLLISLFVIFLSFSFLLSLSLSLSSLPRTSSCSLFLSFLQFYHYFLSRHQLSSVFPLFLSIYHISFRSLLFLSLSLALLPSPSCRLDLFSSFSTSYFCFVFFLSPAASGIKSSAFPYRLSRYILTHVFFISIFTYSYSLVCVSVFFLIFLPYLFRFFPLLLFGVFLFFPRSHFLSFPRPHILSFPLSLLPPSGVRVSVAT